ncbi:hypothetical protein Pint_27535 [Pistacia integerrima]|uniref:Uncharacterized protein n=1 Tax=Pistacia integerrima TaxID=434235 RepID=A0ACC0YPQ8_9ROSI|nr:hypothetical protein Pint_27535 [Pistacia integerrima]
MLFAGISCAKVTCNKSKVSIGKLANSTLRIHGKLQGVLEDAHWTLLVGAIKSLSFMAGTDGKRGFSFVIFLPRKTNLFSHCIGVGFGVEIICSSCLQIARAFGASDIIAVDIHDEKLQKAKTFGATHTVNAIQEDAIEKIREITGGLGVDVAVEALGRPQTFLQCTQSVKDGGKAVMVGLTQSGAVGEIDINRLVRRKFCELSWYS